MVITGKITDESGDGIPAAVYASDAYGKPTLPSLGVNADINGNFKLDIPSTRYANPSENITAQFVGTTKQTKPLKNVVNFNLNSSNELAEVEVTVNKIKKPNVLKYLIIFTAITGAAIGAFMYFGKDKQENSPTPTV